MSSPAVRPDAAAESDDSDMSTDSGDEGPGDGRVDAPKKPKPGSSRNEAKVVVLPKRKRQHTISAEDRAKSFKDQSFIVLPGLPSKRHCEGSIQSLMMF